MERISNWAGNYTYNATKLHYPTSVEQLQEIVRNARKAKALGSRHSFSSIADTTEDLISLDRMEPSLELNTQEQTVTVNANARYGQICRQLEGAGFALHNLASLPHISVVGACATSTHGSGDRNGSLATAVTGLELIAADGEIKKLTRDNNSDIFPGVVVGLGALGVVTKVMLKLVPAFEMMQVVYENLSMRQLEAHFDEITSCAYSVSLFTDWRGESINQVWIKSRVTDDVPFDPRAGFFGATPAPMDRHPIVEISPVNCTPQMGVVGRWYERLPHFRMEFTPSSGEELQTEYLVPRQFALDAIHAVYGMRDLISPLVQISEIRTIAADDLWVSPFYGQDCIGIHFTWQKDWAAVKQLLPFLEEKLSPFEARPHWGKLFTISSARLRPMYDKLPEFRQLAASLDPEGKFRNAFLEEYLFRED